MSKRLNHPMGPLHTAAFVLGLCLAGPTALAQHAGDVIVAVNSNGQLAIDPAGFVPDLNYFTLPVGGVFFPGWADSSPGFDHLVVAQPADDLFPMQTGASIDLEIIDVDPAFQVVVLGNPPLFLDQPGQSTFLGDHTLHEHLTFHINADALAYDPDQCVWHATFTLRDTGTTAYDDSSPLAFRFTNVELREADGDFDEDSDIDGDDIAAITECLQGPNATPIPTDSELSTCEVDCINPFDFDGDLDVDLEDYASFASVLANE
ncbi:MAG: hypothetical protein DHS20C16_05700 [Phycisphaerae bacterium]|nr:MAG: hypothetical protein DHS20C16_05700 [Phycisphaerae bacterium]